MRTHTYQLNPMHHNIVDTVFKIMTDGSPKYRLRVAQCSILDAVLKIMNESDKDGPRPMKNMRPSKKQRTGAEKFKFEHQSEYEVQGREDTKIKEVMTHNKAYPKMYDELDKRRSLAKPTALVMNRKPSLTSYCDSVTSHLQTKGRNNRYTKSLKHGTRTVKNKITKHKTTKKRTNFYQKRHFKLHQSTKACQYQCSTLKLIEKSVSTCDLYYEEPQLEIRTNNFEIKEPLHEIEVNNEGNIVLPHTYNLHEIEVNNEENIALTHTVQSIVSNKVDPKSNFECSRHSLAPQTNPHSMSSYNSFLSLDHEPMVE